MRSDSDVKVVVCEDCRGTNPRLYVANWIQHDGTPGGKRLSTVRVCAHEARLLESSRAVSPRWYVQW